MKVWIESPYNKSGLVKSVKKAGIKIARHKPDFVITYGGDGTILRAEHKFPGIPKIPIRMSRLCSMCISYGTPDIRNILERLKNGKYELKKVNKTEAVFGNKKLVGLNEIQIHNKDPRKALRFNLVNGKNRFDGVIGDGLVFATSYGSTAYYRALGYSRLFQKGIRIGFNNVYPHRKDIALKEKAFVKVIREYAFLICDNNYVINLKPGDIVEIRESHEQAVFVLL